MIDDPRVDQLLEELLESGGLPEEVCRSCPELLPQVRAGMQRLGLLEQEVDAMFPASTSQGGDAPAALPTAELPRIPGYEVQGELGRGGVGVVYRAWHLRLNRPVALKMLLAGPYARPEERERFLREAQALAALGHPNVVQVHEVGDLDGLPYFTMEYLEGGSLAMKLAGNPLPAHEAAVLSATLAEAVELAHLSGIVHRDLKPANVLLTSAGTPKIGDFGIARRLDGGAGSTRTGTALGTPSYMAPEQARGERGAAGPPADIYALGAILYELLTGRPPFRAESASATVQQVLSEDPVPPSRLNPRVPRDLQTICLQCLQKDPRRRYATAAALADDLNRFLRDQPIAARPVGRPERLLRWVRRNPTAAALIVTAAMLLGLAGGAGVREWGLAMRQRAELEKWSERLAYVIKLQGQGRFVEARGILQQPDAGTADLRKQIEQARADLDLVERLDDIRLRTGYVDAQGLHVDFAESSRHYLAAFREFGLGEPQEDPHRVAERLKASPIQKALVAALDDWAPCADKEVRDWVLRVARRMDPDPWRDRVRDPDGWETAERFPELADMAIVEDQPANLMVSFGSRWDRLGGDPTAFLEKVQRRYPEDFWVNLELARLLVDRDPAFAIGYCRAAEVLRPDSPLVQFTLCAAFNKLGQLDDAIHHESRGLRGSSGNPLAWFHLGWALLERGRPAEAADCLRKSLALDPSNANVRDWLRASLLRQGRGGEARLEWRQLIDRAAKVHDDWAGYAELCLFLGDVAEYHRGCRELLARFDSSTDPFVCERTGRACLLLPETPQQMQRAAALIDRALADKSPSAAWATPFFLFAKGLAEYRRNSLRSAIAILEGEASRVLGPAPQIILAMARYRSGEREEARRTLASAVIEYDWRAPSADRTDVWINHVLRREAEAMLFPNLPAFLEGTYQPADQCERLAFLGACEFNNLTYASARLFADAFAAEPSLANDPESARRYYAACMAASAGCGRGKDASNVDDAERARLRDQARQWLRADAAESRKRLDSGLAAKPWVEDRLKRWRVDADLAGLREPDSLARLPVAESRACRQLWKEGDLQLERARRRD